MHPDEHSFRPWKQIGIQQLDPTSGRVERLRRSRWQWFSMVALLLVLRMQVGAPLVLEVMVALQFIIFIAIPTTPAAKQVARKV